MALIEIDGLPNLEMVDLSMAMLNDQMVTVKLNRWWRLRKSILLQP